MKEYFKMKDVFAGKVKEGLTVNGPSIHGDNHAFYANTKDRRIAVYASHAINSHDELVAEVERLTQSLNHANSNHELFERQYYLEKDKCEDLQAEVDRLRESLKWAVNNLPFENAFEWSDDENADAHYAALRLLGVDIEE